MKKILIISMIIITLSISLFYFSTYLFKNPSRENQTANASPVISQSDKSLVKQNVSKDLPYEVYFLYSHPDDKKTFLASTKNGKDFDNYTLNASDILNIKENPDKLGGLYLVPEHYDLLYKFNGNMEFSEEKLISPLTFLISTKDIEIRSYNYDAKLNYLEVNDLQHHKKYKLEYPSYLSTATYDDKYIYVVNAVLTNEEGKYNLHIIDRATGKKVNTIDVPPSVVDITKFREKIVLSSEEKLTVVNLDDWKVSTIEYPLATGYPHRLYVRNNNLYLTYIANGNSYILIMDQNFSWIKHEELNFPYMAAAFKDDKLYLMQQYELTEKFGGIMGIFDLATLNKETEILLPKKKHKVQDLLILDK